MSYKAGDKVRVVAPAEGAGDILPLIDGKKGTVTSADSGYVAFDIDGEVYTTPEAYVEPA